MTTTKIQYNGTTYDIELTDSQKKQIGIQDKTVVWKPEEGEEVYDASDEGSYRYNESLHNKYVLSGILFPTKEQAAQEYKRLCAIKRVRDYCVTTFGEFVPDWSQYHQLKICVDCDFAERLSLNHCNLSYPASSIPYLESYEQGEQLIKDMEEDLRIIFGIN